MVLRRTRASQQTFWNEFFDIFGIPRRTIASFEEPVRRLRGTCGFIDLLWKGKLLIEHKSAGASLDAAETQAFDYLHDLQTVCHPVTKWRDLHLPEPSTGLPGYTLA